MSSDVRTSAPVGATAAAPLPARRPARPAPGSAATHTAYLALRRARAVARQPAYLLITLFQPIVWLLLFGELFRRVVELPGFGGGGSYLAYLTPGVVVMTSLFSNSWTGMTYIEEMDSGVLSRMLASPVRRGALLGGDLVNSVLTTAVQSLIVVALALACNARFASGVTGTLVLLGAAVVIGIGIAALSVALGLVVRQRESLIAASQFIVLPLTFMSSSFLPQTLTPGWIQAIGHANPVNWAVNASHSALSGGAPGTVLPDLGYLAAFAVVAIGLALAAFRALRRSM